MAMKASRIEPIKNQQLSSHHLVPMAAASASYIVPRFRRCLSPLRGMPVRSHAPKASVAV
jgi:hypothetical protein